VGWRGGRSAEAAGTRTRRQTGGPVRTPTTARLGWGVWVTALVLATLTCLFAWLNSRDAGSVWDDQRWLFVAGTTLLFCAPGGLIVTHRPANPIGWLLCVIGLIAGLGGAAQGYGEYAVDAPGRILALWIANTLGLLILAPVPVLFLLFPDGRPPSRWWWLVGWLTAVAAAGLALGPALYPGPLGLGTQPANPPNPVGIAGAEDLMSGLFFWGAMLLFMAAALALASVSDRFQRARGVERQQLKWFLYGAVALILTLLFGLVPAVEGITAIPALAGFGVFTTCVAIAILRHRLYNIDLLITRTVVYGLLTAAFTAIYLVIVVGIGTLVGSRGEPNLLLSIIATALIAVAFEPARERSRRLANRLVYGKRASPYEVLSAFSQAMAGASTDDSLLRMARLVVEATGALGATVWLRLGEVLQAQASWPQAEPIPEPIPLEGRGVEEALAMTQPRSRTFSVGYEDDLLGALTVAVSPREPLTPAGERLIADLATQTGLGLRFQRMKERALFARALASFLPPEVAELVEASPSALSLREELEATILFSDIRGFSSLAERLPPREVADVVGRHLAAMVEVVTAHGGVLDKFAGDAVMAVFGAPRPAQDHAQRALACAAAMQRRQLALNDAAVHESLPVPVFQIGIGVNTGTVIAGTLGGPGRLDYTVLGDAVNIAQRLQSEAAGGEILASAVTVRQAGTHRAESVGRKQLKGRHELVHVYRIHWAGASAAQPGETAYAE
jgi:class 3 adenylate cyclase